MATVPVVLLPVKMRLPLPDVGKRTKKIQTPVPADPEILPQTSIRFIKLPRRKPNQAKKKKKGGGLLSAATSLTTGSVKLGGTLFYLVIQWICVVLMALSTLRMAQNFWANRVTWLHRRRSSGKELCPGNLSDWGTDLCGLWLYPGTVDRQQKTDAGPRQDPPG